MAYKRLIIERSPGLALFGVAWLVAAYALMKAYHRSFEVMMEYGKPYVWLPLYAIGAYLVVRGAHGAWWRELRIDRDGRSVKTVDGHIVPFDKLGTLAIVERELRAEGVERALYRSPFGYELERLRDALDDALGRGGRRPRAHRLQRLAFHRSWGLFVFTLVGFSYITLPVGEQLLWGGDLETEYLLLASVGYVVCFLWFRRALFGSFSSSQLFVDIPGGLLQLADGRVRRFADLGALSLVERRPRYDGRRHRLSDFDLRAANIEDALFTDTSKARTEQRLAALSTAVLAHDLRRVLESAPDDGAGSMDGAFRQAPPLSAELARVAGDSPYRAAALAALAADPDPVIRDRARAAVSRVSPPA